MYKNILIILVLLAVYPSFAQKYSGLERTWQLYNDGLYIDGTDEHSVIKPYIISSEPDSVHDGTVIHKLLNEDLIAFGANDLVKVNPILCGYSVNGDLYSYGLGVAMDINLKQKFHLNLRIANYNSLFESHIHDRIDSTEMIPQYNLLKYRDGERHTYDLSIGYLSYSFSKYINVQAGIDKNFIGDGYRSLLLSDNSGANPFLKGTVDIWKIKYMVLYSLFRDFRYGDTGGVLYDKFITTHVLSLNAYKWLNLYLYESVIWDGGGATNYRGVDLNYMNPIIFFRPVEFSLGEPTPDNVIIGGGTKVSILKKNHLYFQLVLDEFNLNEIKKKNDWWGNKYGYQVGIRMHNLFGAKGLVEQIEYNKVRPFTYSHGSTMGNFGGYGQSLAHPLGANFFEVVNLLSYRIERFNIATKVLYSELGSDFGDGDSYGQNMYMPYQSRVSEYGNVFGQGLKNKLAYGEIMFGFLLNPKSGLQIETGCAYRKHVSNTSSTDLYFRFGLKSLIFNSYNEF